MNQLKDKLAEAETRAQGKRISVVAADCRPLVLAGIASALANEAGISLIASARNGDETLASIARWRPDVVLLQLHMPGKDALDVVDALIKSQLPTRPVILAGAMTGDEFTRARRLRVPGIFSLLMEERLLVRCIQEVHAGSEFMELQIRRRSFEASTAPPYRHARFSDLLTVRECAIAELALSGLGNKQVARKLGISEGTVKVHLHRIYTKLKIRGRFALMKFVQDKAPPHAADDEGART